MAMILVSLPYDGGVATVYRDDEGTWLNGTLLDQRPGREGVGGGRWAVGGLLPPGASRAIVEGEEAVTRGGAWLAVIDAPGMFGEPAVRYEAADGTIVRPQLPADWARELVADADEPCPACGGAKWERVTPTDDSRGTHGWPTGAERPAPVIVCVRCGHEESEGTWFAATGEDPDAAVEDRRPPGRPTPDGLDFPVYALSGAAAEMTGQGWDTAGVHSVTISHDGVRIETGALRHAYVDAREASADALTAVVHDADPPRWKPGSRAAMALRLRRRDRAVASRVARALPFSVEIPVDGEPVRFDGVRCEAGWAAVGRTENVQITIGARRIAPEAVALRRL
jgi:hypothetical protein